MKFIWNGAINCFVEYNQKYELKIDDETGDRLFVEIPCDQRIYTEEEVNAIFSSCKEGEAIKDVNGVPTVFKLITDSELAINAKKQRIDELKALLASTDYQAIQWAEGVRSEEVYAPMRLQRETWREEIREIEAELGI